MQNPVLTIAIPTYSRANFLDLGLNSIISQLDGLEQDVELIVINDASTDNTNEIVAKYLQKTNFYYQDNKVNLGFDSSFATCYEKSNGKYLWILGDDEFLFEGSLKRIVDLLKNNNYGDVYLQCIPYHNIKETGNQSVADFKTITYHEPIEFIKKIHYYVTFISGNIINKALLPKDIDPRQYMETNLVQVGWYMKAIFASKENLFVETPSFGAKQNNSGGYQFVTTFTKNYNHILRSLAEEGMDKRIIRITNENLIDSYFPANVIKLLYYENRFKEEKHFSIFLKHYWNYKSFWTKLFPIYAKYWIKKALGRKIVKYSN